MDQLELFKDDDRQATDEELKAFFCKKQELLAGEDEVA